MTPLTNLSLITPLVLQTSWLKKCICNSNEAHRSALIHSERAALGRSPLRIFCPGRVCFFPNAVAANFHQETSTTHTHRRSVSIRSYTASEHVYHTRTEERDNGKAKSMCAHIQEGWWQEARETGRGFRVQGLGFTV